MYDNIIGAISIINTDNTVETMVYQRERDMIDSLTECLEVYGADSLVLCVRDGRDTLLSWIACVITEADSISPDIRVLNDRNIKIVLNAKTCNDLPEN